MPRVIDQLIINSPYEEPHEHWTYDRESRSFSRVAGRRSAGEPAATLGIVQGGPGESPQDGVAGVSAEAVAAPRIESVRGPQQSHHALAGHVVAVQVVEAAPPDEVID